MPSEQITETAKNIDLSLVISIAALILSVLSPVISSVIGGVFHIREKKLDLKAEAERRNHEFYEQHRAEVIERYINTVGKAAQNFVIGNIQEFGESMGEVYMYVDQSLWPLLDSIAAKINRHNFSDPSAELRELCKKLSADGVRPEHKEELNSADKQKPDKVNNKC